MVFVIAWIVVRRLRVLSVAVENQMARRGIADGAAIVRIGRGAAIAVVWLLGVAAALQIFGLDLSTAIAGLGIGTAAIALASQQTLADLFGGASVVADRTVLVVPNGDLAQTRIEKLSTPDGFRHVVTLGLRHETRPDTVLAIVADLEQRMEDEPLEDPKSAMAHFIGFGESSLNIEVRGMFRTLDMPTYRAALQPFPPPRGVGSPSRPEPLARPVRLERAAQPIAGRPIRGTRGNHDRVARARGARPRQQDAMPRDSERLCPVHRGHRHEQPGMGAIAPVEQAHLVEH